MCKFCTHHSTNEKDDSFKSSIGQIYQTFGGEDLYPSVEEKAAMLLYLVTKNHSFSDGNKRIAATLFLWFLNNNGILYREDGSKRIADNTLVALTLMIAESKPEEKDVMVKVVARHRFERGSGDSAPHVPHLEERGGRDVRPRHYVRQERRPLLHREQRGA